MAENEKTSDKLSRLASKAMREPEKMTQAEIKSLGATALTQSNDKPKAKAPAPKPAPKSPPSKKR